MSDTMSRRRGWRGAAAILLVGGSATIAVPGAGSVSALLVTDTFSYTGPAVAIPESPGPNGTAGTTASATLTVSGVAANIDDLNFRFDGSSCNANVGSTTVGLDHDWIGDLIITLESPSGTTVTLVDRMGTTDPGFVGNSGNNFCQTVLDDEGSNPIESASSTTQPFTGTYTPNNPLSVFDGEDPNGIWTLRATDHAAANVGNIRAFSLVIESTESALVLASKTVSGTFEEEGSVTYSVVLSNSGNTASLDNAGDEFTDVLPAALTLTSAIASSGTAVATIGTNTVTWNGSVPAGGAVSIGITATINAGTQNTTISNQGSLLYDPDLDGTNEQADVTDYPGVAGTGNPTSFVVGDLVPHVTVTVAPGQENPTAGATIHFRVLFSESVTGFDETDVVLSGTAGATTAVVTGSGAEYDVAVSGMTVPGTVIVTVPADVAIGDGQGVGNTASTGDANVASYLVPVVPRVGAGPSVQYGFWIGLMMLATGSGLFLVARRRTA